jgi:hypothetical protein
MKEKPLCGYCYNECTDDCCDKRRIDVLERQLEETREAIYKYAEIALMEGKGEFGHSWEDFKFYVLDEQLKEQEK